MSTQTPWGTQLQLSDVWQQPTMKDWIAIAESRDKKAHTQLLNRLAMMQIEEKVKAGESLNAMEQAYVKAMQLSQGGGTNSTTGGSSAQAPHDTLGSYQMAPEATSGRTPLSPSGSPGSLSYTDKYRELSGIEANPRDWQGGYKSPNGQLVTAAAQKYGVPLPLAHAVADQESGYVTNATSKDKQGRPLARGVMQIIDSTGRGLGLQNPYDPAENTDTGMRLLRQLYDQYGDWDKALIAYAAGGSRVPSGDAKMSPVYSAYVAPVRSREAKFTRLFGGEEVPRETGAGSGAEVAQPGGLSYYAAPGTDVPVGVPQGSAAPDGIRGDSGVPGRSPVVPYPATDETTTNATGAAAPTLSAETISSLTPDDRAVPPPDSMPSPVESMQQSVDTASLGGNIPQLQTAAGTANRVSMTGKVPGATGPRPQGFLAMPALPMDQIVDKNAPPHIQAAQARAYQAAIQQQDAMEKEYLARESKVVGPVFNKMWEQAVQSGDPKDLQVVKDLAGRYKSLAPWTQVLDGIKLHGGEAGTYNSMGPLDEGTAKVLISRARSEPDKISIQKALASGTPIKAAVKGDRIYSVEPYVEKPAGGQNTTTAIAYRNAKAKKPSGVEPTSEEIGEELVLIKRTADSRRAEMENILSKSETGEEVTPEDLAKVHSFLKIGTAQAAARPAEAAKFATDTYVTPDNKSIQLSKAHFKIYTDYNDLVNRVKNGRDLSKQDETWIKENEPVAMDVHDRISNQAGLLPFTKMQDASKRKAVIDELNGPKGVLPRMSETISKMTDENFDAVSRWSAQHLGKAAAYMAHKEPGVGMGLFKSYASQAVNSAVFHSLPEIEKEFIIRSLSLNESLMALRPIGGFGQGAVDVRDAIQATAPGNFASSKEYAQKQVGELVNQVNTLGRSVSWNVPLSPRPVESGDLDKQGGGSMTESGSLTTPPVGGLKRGESGEFSLGLPSKPVPTPGQPIPAVPPTSGTTAPSPPKSQLPTITKRTTKEEFRAILRSIPGNEQATDADLDAEYAKTMRSGKY